jgi:hypothetical protein
LFWGQKYLPNNNSINQDTQTPHNVGLEGVQEREIEIEMDKIEIKNRKEKMEQSFGPYPGSNKV